MKKEVLIKLLLDAVKVKAGESAKEVLNMIKNHIEDLIDNISIEDIKECWNLTEKEIEELSLEKCISIVKKEFNQKLYSSACILKKECKSKYKFEIHICFLDKANEPMLNGNASHWIIHTNKLDNNLLNQFGSKDMIILK